MMGSNWKHAMKRGEKESEEYSQGMKQEEAKDKKKYTIE